MTTTADLARLTGLEMMQPGMGQVRAVGTVLHRGRKQSTAEGKLYDADGRLLAHGTTTCVILRCIRCRQPRFRDGRCATSSTTDGSPRPLDLLWGASEKALRSPPILTYRRCPGAPPDGTGQLVPQRRPTP